MIFTLLACIGHCFHVSSLPCNVSLAQSCPASLYYVPNSPKTLAAAASLFHVDSNLVRQTVDGYLVNVNCSCPAGHIAFTWHMDYTVQLNVTLDLLCGCSKDNKEIVTYRVKHGDTLYTICSRFSADLNQTVQLNGIDNSGLIYDGDVIFIPEPVSKVKKTPKPRISMIVKITLAAVSVVTLLVMSFVWSYCYKRSRIRQAKAYSRRTECLHCYLTTCSFHKKSEESMASSFNLDKATVFSYIEVCDATCNFSMSLKIGQGSYGSVYLGKLRGIDVAIKQMKETKSKEFFSELHILSRVHHTNLIKLIGYAGGGDSLFLVYEFAQNGALSHHLHRPTARGYKPLQWTTRLQIALDAARGLEYIHEHTKPYYVHRDVKTSNILLDSNFRAKIADFGLVKLFEHSPNSAAAASRIVGTFGYLAPEYIRDGCVTTKSDVYAYGVVLMELLTGQPALSRDANPGNDQYIEHRSLLLSALNDSHDSLMQCIDPNLIHYHADSVFQMALLSKDCVDDDWNQRPDMSSIVIRLLHLLARSREWEKLECSNPMS
ncbi:LysM domain receptor-like kinase 3 [Vitis vinifera]|uniref:LysM domain receptor-like kinase 3 n=1 Tax=Vitis vinifera TaxID=29760 RepID=A0A438KE68_VITVI|nr:LysM domain receptor-like kinase 3 [Vitis vinifera]